MGIIEKKKVGLFAELQEEKAQLNKEKLISFIENVMKDLTLAELVGMLTNPYQEVLEYIDLCAGKKTCQKTSLLFNPHRLQVKSLSSKVSVYDALSDPSINYSKGLARSLVVKKGKCSEVLYQSIAWNIQGVQYINEFPPHMARRIMQYYKIKSDSRVLDPCAGWGGRMIGISTVCNNYTAFDPSSLTYKGLLKLKKYIQSFSTDFKANLHNTPFEDSRLRADFYDIALTSPPYYNTEEYTDEKNNSLNRYSSFGEWCEFFYIPLIKKTMDSLKDGSVFILNIGSRKYPLNDVLLDTFSTDFKIRKHPKFKLGGTWKGLGKKGEGETFYEIKKDTPVNKTKRARRKK